MKQFLEANRKLSVVYLVWFAFNFIALFISTGISSKYFWPFGSSPNVKIMYNGGWEESSSLYHAYDISEFMVYTVVPVVAILIYNLLSKK